ncbi:MAG: carboxypeptidase regulatory-like domain-containing protein [Blastocatellales bacterium]
MVTKFKIFPRALALICGLTLIVLAGQAGQPKPQTQNESSKPGSIKGRVIGEDGEPLAEVQVFAVAIGRAGERRLPGGNAPTQAVTDDEGNFEISDLPPASYSISAFVPGYVAPGPDEESGLGIYRIGDFANIALIKGGVITGKITNANGEALTGVSVSAIRVADINGETEDQSLPQGFGRNWRTDDRGVYRIYGLTPGTYIVQAGSANRNRPGRNPLSPYSEDSPTYYPSSARDAAMHLAVTAGSEIGGIDIRYRAEKGRAVSGQVISRAANNSSSNSGLNFSTTLIALTLPGTDSVVATTSLIARPFARPFGGGGGRNSQNESASFAFYGIPDGEYEISARRNGLGANESDAIAAPRRISVRGADVSGIQLSLAPLALLGGRVVLEKSPIACPLDRRSSVQEVLLNVERDDAVPPKENSLALLNPLRPAAPTAAGEFVFRNLETGRWRLQAKLPDEFWFVRSINLPLKTPAAAARKTAAANAAAANLSNAGRLGFATKLGEKLTGMIVTVSEGAAGLKGHLVAGEGEKLSGDYTVHLIPAEKESADEVLRYAQTNASDDGGFRFKNIAPGRYYLLAKPSKDAKALRPEAWDQNARAVLQREAEGLGRTIELQSCQRINDYQFSLKSGND